MQLREIHVVRFGVLADVRVHGLVPGLNVLHGPNEFGKTSLLEFVRRVLFGFPTKATKANQYLLPHSDKNSGQLVCELGDGRTLNVSRSTGTHGGPLTVTTPDGASLSGADLTAALGHVSQDLYQKVFSVGLKELYDVDVINLDEVKDRIYGAGLGGVSIPGLKSHFETRANELFTKGGHKQRMKELAADIASLRKDIRDEQSRLAQYDEKQNESARLKQREAELSAAVRALQAEQRRLENQQRLYPTFLAMQRAEQERRDIGEVPEVADEALVELQERQSELKTVAGQIEATQEKLRQKRAALERISYDPSLIRNEADIRSLSQSVASYRSTREGLPLARSELQTAQEQAARRLAVLGEGWTEERARAFTLSTEQEDLLRQQEARLQECEQARDSLRSKLEYHKDSSRAAGGRQGNPKAVRRAGFAVLALGTAGCIMAASDGNALIAVISGAVGLLGLFLAISPVASSDRMNDPVAEQLEAEIRTAEEAKTSAWAQWSVLLQQLGLSPSLSPEAKDEMLRVIEDASRDLRLVDQSKVRIAGLEEIASSIEARYARIVKDVKEPLQGTDVAANIEVLDARMATARGEEVRRQALTNDVNELSEELKGHEGRRQRESTGLAELLTRHEVPSPEALREKFQRFATSRKLQESIDSALKNIEASVGTGDACSAFIETLTTTTPEEILAALAETKERTDAAGNELAETNRLVGALDTELKALISAEDLVSREAEVETLLQQLQDAHKEWLTARIALWGISAAVSRYEEERQPDVIRAAQSAFIGMTAGRYEKLLKPLDSDELHVRDVNGADRTVEELSRGTREQLYLAMRLGLIAQYEQNAEPLPVIMDDILVNFDDDRGPLAVKALAEFAKDRQVIVMTCHESTLALYRQAGATELAMERDGRLL